jgi:hydrogenase nickel incorporation protein HypB
LNVIGLIKSKEKGVKNMKIIVVKNVLDANDRIAADNRALFDKKKIYVINLMSSPGAGKTTLVEKTILALQDRYRIGVIEGDIQDTYDAERVAKLGIPVVQINTGGGCHLDGNMIREALPAFDLDQLDFLITENVGNLVCPAEFKIGENAKIMILSTPEGADKPAKYPLMFQESSVLILNKIDLMPYVDFNMEKAKKDALSLNPKLRIFAVSCKTSEGLQGWLDWLSGQIAAFQKG